METDPRSSVYVAPLSIKKTSNGFFTSAEASIQSNTADNLALNQNQITPPSTPENTKQVMADNDQADVPVFHNYLRAFFHFRPTTNISSSTVTLPLNPGDVILVHSVHTNGWADGTLLESGDRGWLPTNYCEAYEPAAMHHLLNAVTEFWDTIRSANLSTLDVFQSQDYIRGLIAGVRFLLEKSRCLTRDAVLVKSNDRLRRVRKTLLSDLSALVRIAKRLQDIATSSGLQVEGVEEMIDEMLLKAFKVVTGGVAFLDIWNEVSIQSNSLTVTGAFEFGSATGDAPMTPPVDQGSRHDSISETSSTRESVNSSALHSIRSKRTSIISQNAGELPATTETPRAESRQKHRISVSHRMSYTGNPNGRKTSGLVSIALGNSHDAFLSVLGSFIGLHMQSRSSTELLVTTQQAVKSCRQLMTVVETVMKHDGRRPSDLRKAKDGMVDKITDLARAAQDAFRPLANDDLVFMPEDGQRLVDAATACVRAAGECVAQTRHVLEQTGDFEIDPPASTEKEDLATSRATPDENSMSTVQESTRPIAPKLVIPRDESRHSPMGSILTPASQPSTTGSGLTVDTPLTATSIGSDDLPPTPPPKPDSMLGHSSKPSLTRNAARAIVSTGSHSTFVSSVRDSELSGRSVASTAATSIDQVALHGHGHVHGRHSGSQTTNVSGEDCDDTEAAILETTFVHELSVKDGRVVGGSLRSLIEKLTAYDSAPDAEFVSTFYLTFRLFASPLEFAQALAERFDYVAEAPRITNPVRLRVYNTCKGWLEGHWRHDCDNAAIPFLLNFTKTSVMPVLPAAGRRLLELIEKAAIANNPTVPRLVNSIGKTNTAIAQYINPDTPFPHSIISKSQLTTLKHWRENGTPVTILDFDPLEVARQFTIKASQIFCSILPEELLATEWTKQSGSLAVNVRMMSTLSTDLTSLVADSILQLEDPKKRAAVIKQWVKIANKCLELNNYDSLMALYCALTNSTISRMKRTWELVSPKTKSLLATLGAVVDNSKNYSGLRQRLQNLMPPCLPFVGMYLTDLTFVDHGNPATRKLSTGETRLSIINFDKHVKTAKIISDLQRFQIPYRLTEIPELQTWIQDELIRVRSTGDKSFQTFYRRSLVLEPKEMPNRGPSPISMMPHLPHTKEKFDFLAWTHSSKDKSISTH